jgi:hypothetical protein
VGGPLRGRLDGPPAFSARAPLPWSALPKHTPLAARPPLRPAPPRPAGVVGPSGRAPALAPIYSKLSLSLGLDLPAISTRGAQQQAPGQAGRLQMSRSPPRRAAATSAAGAPPAPTVPVRRTAGGAAKPGSSAGGAPPARRPVSAGGAER